LANRFSTYHYEQEIVQNYTHETHQPYRDEWTVKFFSPSPVLIG